MAFIVGGGDRGRGCWLHGAGSNFNCKLLTLWRTLGGKCSGRVGSKVSIIDRHGNHERRVVLSMLKRLVCLMPLGR